ncbi:protein TALPID3 isoform X6, partial [Clarias magur]
MSTLINATPSSSSSTVQQAKSMLQDLSRLKDEMRNIIQPSEQDDQVTPQAIPLSRRNRRQSSHPPASMFEDAERVLRQVRQSRKVLEENLQAVLRANDGEMLHTQLEALANNRDASEQLRIKKTVDAWINTLSKEIQDELTQHGSGDQMKAVERDSVAAGGSARRDQSSGSRSTAGKAPGRLGRERKGATAAAKREASHRDSNRPQAASAQPSSQELASSFRNSTEQQHPQASALLKSEGDEAYLRKVYGKALYEGHRRTLKKGPYLRFSSPTPKSKVQRPKMVESVKGVKMKSCKTQTSVCDASLLQPVTSEPQYVFSPVEDQQPGSVLKGYLMPMAIPLGKPRVYGQGALLSRVVVSDKPATVITSIPPAPKVTPVFRKPNTLLLEVQSGPKKPAPNLQIQVQPSVNIESVSALSRTSSTSPPPPPLSPPHLPPSSFQTGADARAFGDETDENDGFPGTNFLEVTDSSQEPEMEAEFPDSPIELHGLPSPPAALYHGPTFPTQPHQPSTLTQPILAAIEHRETLENRLVDWVEQQLMARMIIRMFPQSAHTDPTTQSEPEDSATSDTRVETAGALQLFVDAGVPVDSELIRQYVNEVLADMIALTLGQREGPREPPGSSSAKGTHNQQESAVPTPVPTPEPSVNEDPPALREVPSPISTPDLSAHPSPTHSPRDSQHAEPQQPVLPEPEKEQVKTPVCTPVPSPRRIQTPESPSVHNQPWGNAELPLTEEKPHSEGEEQQPLPNGVLSVACEEVEEDNAVIHPFSPVPPKPQNRPTATVEHTEPAPPESPSVKESSSHTSTSITEMETETAARHISEGELLLSCGQMAAVRVLEEEGFILPNLMTSFNSSLHGVQDMDYDPPSEGEVVRRPLVPAHHDPVLSLLARMDQGPVSQSQQERLWDEESSGEVSEGQRPVLTETQEKVVMGHSLITQGQSVSAEQPSHASLLSPGQSQAQHTGEKGAVAKNGGLSVNVSLSAEHTDSSHVLHSFNASSLQSGDSTPKQVAETPNRPTPILVKQYKSTEEPVCKSLTGEFSTCAIDQSPVEEKEVFKFLISRFKRSENSDLVFMSTGMTEAEGGEEEAMNQELICSVWAHVTLPLKALMTETLTLAKHFRRLFDLIMEAEIDSACTPTVPISVLNAQCGTEFSGVMRQTTAALVELLNARDCAGMRDRKEYESRSRERGEAEQERHRARDRMEATLAGLAELDYLRQRQELLVQNALNNHDNISTSGEEDHQLLSAAEDNYLNNEEKMLEENILLLRKQLNCLRRRDAGLISQLQELDRQISDLRLDTETGHEHLESDSRPSSGFYELSDGTSGSLSNSSNSVFSECLSSCRSTSCLCAPLDTSLCASEGRPKSS